MKRFLGLISSVAMVAIGLVAQPIVTQPSQAAPASSAFDPGLIISDTVFFDFGTMTVSDIQAFLDSKVADCRATDPAVDCLKNYISEIPETPATLSGEVGPCKAIAANPSATSAEVIYAIANACGINPKVLIVTLQKEQGLVTSTKPTDYMYRAAMGFGCPDSDPGICGKVYTGLFNQLYRAAKQFRWYGNPAGSFTYWKPGRTVAMRYNPKSTCGTKSFELKSQATANLYYYTPYTPNDAALNNLYGTGDSCSAYGNRNFWRFFHDWFGSPISGSYLVKSATSGVYLISDNLRYSVTDTRLVSALRPLGPVGEISQGYLDSFTDAGTATQVVKTKASNQNYLLVNGTKYAASCEVLVQYGLSCDLAITLTDSQLNVFIDGGSLTQFVVNSNSVRYWIEYGKKRLVVDDLALAQVGAQGLKPLLLEVEQLLMVQDGQPLASELLILDVADSSQQLLLASGGTYLFDADLVSTVKLSNWFQSAGVEIDSSAIPSSAIKITGLVRSADNKVFLLSSSGRVLVSDPENWLEVIPTLPQSMLDKIPVAQGSLSAPVMVTFSGSTSSYFINDGTRRTSTTSGMTKEFLALLDQDKTVTVPKSLISAMPHAGIAIAPGVVIKSKDSKTLYLADDLTGKIELASAGQASSVSTSSVFSFDKRYVSVLETRTGFNSLKVSCNGSTYLLDKGTLIPAAPSVLAEYPGTAYPLSYSTCASFDVLSKTAGQFIRSSSKKIYLVTDGKKILVANFTQYKTLVGNAPAYVYVSDYFLSKIPNSSAPITTANISVDFDAPRPDFSEFTFGGELPVSTPTPTPTSTPTPTPTPSPTPTASSEADPGVQQTYKVVAGDTLYKVATKFSTTVSKLQSWNSLGSSTAIRIGQILKVSAPTQSESSVPTSTPTPTPTPSPTPTPTPSPAPAQSSSVVEYKVQSGDTLAKIAAKFGVTSAAIQTLNKITNANLIKVGQLLKIPTTVDSGTEAVAAEPEAAQTTYVVKSGDTLWGISRKFGVSVTALAELNGINNGQYIKVGQVLKIPS